MIAEEWGFAGAAVVLGLLLLLILGGMTMAICSRNRFGRLVGLGISMNFFFYCLVNLSMVMGAIPVGGCRCRWSPMVGRPCSMSCWALAYCFRHGYIATAILAKT